MTNSWKKWNIFVEQSKSSLEKGGSATLDAFIGLAPVKTVSVVPAIFPGSRSKGPLVRCVALNDNRKQSFDMGNVDSVDKVYLTLTQHMGEVRLYVSSCLSSNVVVSLCRLKPVIVKNSSSREMVTLKQER